MYSDEMLPLLLLLYDSAAVAVANGVVKGEK